MKKSLIVIKPFDIEFPEECLKNCWDNHNVTFGALFWEKGGNKLHTVSFDKWYEVEKWAKDINKDYHAILHFGGRTPSYQAHQPYKTIKDGNYIYYFHSGDLDIINTVSSGNEDVSLWEAFFKPLSIPGVVALTEELSKDPKNGQFLLFTKDEPYTHQFGEGWEEENGIIFSNSEHKKKVSFAPASISSRAPAYFQTAKEKASPESIDFFGIRIARPLPGITKYFKIDSENPVARVDFSNHPEIKPMDWIMSIGGTEFKFAELPEFVEKKKRRHKFNLHIRIKRFDQIAHSRKEEGACKEFTVIFNYDDKKTEIINVLTETQRHFIITTLVNTMFENEDETTKKSKRLIFENGSDEMLIDMCSDRNLGWEHIK